MALRIGLTGWTLLGVFALATGCASDESDVGNAGGTGAFGGGVGATGGSGGFTPFGGTGGGGSGGVVGGAGGTGGGPIGGSGGTPTGGSGGVPSGGAGGVPFGGGTGGGGAGGTGGGNPDSCVGNCGAQAPGGCFCDTGCFGFGDCCADYTTVCSSGTGGAGGTGGSGTGGAGGTAAGGSGGGANSCVGSCGLKAPGGCYCDSGCVGFGDCCPDFATVCGTGTGGTGGTGGTATGGTGGTATGGTGGTATGGTGGTGGTVGGCANAEDCSNPATMICDPKTLTCQAGQCTGTQACSNTNDICVAQVSSPVVGACYPKCKPYNTSTGCSGTQECLSVYLDGSEGACFTRGTAADGQACTTSDVGTGCAAGAVCVRDTGSYFCRKLCNFFASSPACVASQRCALGGVCIAEGGDSAAIGQACSTSSVAGESCGNDGKAWRGTCQNVSGSGLTCLKICRTSVTTDCASGKTCVPFQGDNSTGACL